MPSNTLKSEVEEWLWERGFSLYFQGRKFSPYAATVKGTRFVTTWKSGNLK
jgi:hypothetical protein